MPAGAQARKIGQRLRRLRQEAGLTAEELAARSAVATAEIEAIESGEKTPAVGQLLNLAKALGVAPGHLFQEERPSQRIEVVRSGERWRVERASSESGTSLSYSYEALSYRLTEKAMQPFLIEVSLGLDQPVQPSQHDGEEFMFVLDGELELHVQDQKIRLGPGDSCYFDSRLPHVLRAASARPARLIVVVSTAWAAGHAPPLTRAF